MIVNDNTSREGKLASTVMIAAARSGLRLQPVGLCARGVTIERPLRPASLSPQPGREAGRAVNKRRPEHQRDREWH